MKMILLGDHIGGEEASAFGLVANLSEPGSVLEHAIKCAAQLSAQSSTAVALAKESISRGKLSKPTIFFLPAPVNKVALSKAPMLTVPPRS
jgi:enoyl-CoA hydratase/carnithine racemase